MTIAGETKRLIPPTMKDISRNCIFVLYAPAMDQSFANLAHEADFLIYYDNENEFPNPGIKNYSRSGKRKNELPHSQKTLV